MNWDAIGAIGEIIGAAAVVASLLYLAVQTRTNAKALRANAIWDAETIFGTANLSHAANPEWAALLGRALVSDASMDDFSPTEQSQLQFTVRGALQYFQAQWSLFEEGLLPKEIWERRRRFVRGFIELPVVKVIWEAEVQQHIVPEEFRRSVESATLEGNVSIGKFGAKGT